LHITLYIPFRGLGPGSKIFNMKKLFTTILITVLTTIAFAQSQDYTIINVTTPGTLKSILAANGEPFIFYLKVTGNIDLRDIYSLRDDNPALAFLDLSETTISDYLISPGTAAERLSPANTMPEYSFSNVNAWRGFSPLVSIKLPNNLTAFNQRAFFNCTALTDITIPNTVTIIGRCTFYHCHALKSIIIPNSVKIVSDSALMECNGLTDLTIVSSDTYFNKKAFFWCKNLKTITCLGSTPPQFGDQSFDYLDALTTVYVPAASLAAYKASKWGTLFYIKIKANPTDDLTGITSSVKVYSAGSAIQVEGTALGETVTLYSITGKQLKIIVSNGEKLNIPVDKQGIYLVKIGGKTYKVVV